MCLVLLKVSKNWMGTCKKMWLDIWIKWNLWICWIILNITILSARLMKCWKTFWKLCLMILEKLTIRVFLMLWWFKSINYSKLLNSNRCSNNNPNNNNYKDKNPKLSKGVEVNLKLKRNQRLCNIMSILISR